MGLTRKLGSFGAEIDAISQRQAYNNFRKARVLFEKIVARTPVLSGELRAAWAASYGAPVYRYLDVRRKHDGMVPLPKPEFGLTYDRKAAWHIFITNGAPYAKRVEDGWSQQAPVGMVRISVLEVYGGSGIGIG